MFVRNVVSDSYVDGGRDGQTVSRREDTEWAMRELAEVDATPDIFPEAERQLRGLSDPIVDLAGFAPHPKLAGADVAVHALGGGADAGQFVIVNHAGTVHGHVIDETALHQIDDVAVHSGANYVGAHDEDS